MSSSKGVTTLPKKPIDLRRYEEIQINARLDPRANGEAD